MKKLVRDRRVQTGIVLIIAGVLLLLSAPLLMDKGREDLFYMSGYGASLSEMPGENQVFSYSVDLSNNGSSSYLIQSLEPVISDEIESYVLEGIPIIPVNKRLSPGKKIQIQGELRVDTSQMNQEEIRELLYNVQTFKVSYDDNRKLILTNGIPY